MCHQLRELKKMFKSVMSRFSVENLPLTVPKNFVGEAFCVSHNVWYRKTFRRREPDDERGSITIFCQKTFSDSDERFVRGALMCFKKFQNSRKMSRIKEVLSITYSRRNCNIIVRNHNVEEPFCIPEIFVYQKILCLGGEFIDSLQKKNFVSQCRRLL